MGLASLVKEAFQLANTKKLTRRLRRGDNFLRGAKALLYPTDVNRELDYILYNDKNVRKKVEQNPHYRNILLDELASSYKQFKNPLRYARGVDLIDSSASVFSLASQLVSSLAGPLGPGIATALKAEELTEPIYKIPFALYYLGKTGDVGALPKWALYELISLIPYVGDLVDIAPVYLNHVKGRMRKTAVNKFLNRIKHGGLEERVQPVIQKDLAEKLGASIDEEGSKMYINGPRALGHDFGLRLDREAGTAGLYMKEAGRPNKYAENINPFKLSVQKGTRYIKDMLGKAA